MPNRLIMKFEFVANGPWRKTKGPATGPLRKTTTSIKTRVNRNNHKLLAPVVFGNNFGGIDLPESATKITKDYIFILGAWSKRRRNPHRYRFFRIFKLIIRATGVVHTRNLIISALPFGVQL